MTDSFTAPPGAMEYDDDYPRPRRRWDRGGLTAVERSRLGPPMKKSQLDIAIEELQAQRKVLSLAIATLEQEKEKAQKKPRKVRNPFVEKAGA
jgi:hypothetical protein